MSQEQRRSSVAVVPAVNAPSSVAIARSLGRRGIDTIPVSEQDSPPAFWSRYTTEAVSVPSPREDVQGYQDALLSLARRPDVGTIFPVREADVFVLARDRSTFAEHVGTPWPTMESLEAVHDRHELFAAAERADVPIPETTPIDEVEDWDQELIVKGRFAVLTADYVEGFPENRMDSPPKTLFLDPGDGADEIETMTEMMGHVPIAQEYVSGTEYCFRGLYDHGEPVATSQKRLVRGYKYPRGPSIYHEAVDIPRLEEIGRALLEELDWHGIASVGFIRDDEGTFKLLEINPRFPSSIPMDLHAGTDYPAYVWELAHGNGDGVRQSYRPGVASHLLRGELVHLHSVLFEDYPLAERPSPVGTAWNIARSLVEQPNFDYLSLDDPGPFVRDVLNTGRSAILR